MSQTEDRAGDQNTEMSHARWKLFLSSLLILFLELAFIRWFPSHVLFLTFFTNTVLLACFLGMSLGCLAARHQRNYLAWTPILLCVGLFLGTFTEGMRDRLEKMLDVGNQTSPQMVYFGTEYKASDVAQFAIPVEVVVGVFFVLIALTMVGPGQVLGRALNQVPNRVQAYTINILGSLVGIGLFAAGSWNHLGPMWWFVPIILSVAYLLFTSGWAQLGRLRWAALASLALTPVLIQLPVELRARYANKGKETHWSPYYRITYAPPPTRGITVNLIGFQGMIARDQPFPAYSLPYLLNRDSGGAPFKNVLIIGAGSGNDVSRALEWTGPNAHIDAVEIDPLIYELGKKDHPDRPYDDPRVTVHLNDGRNFLRSTDKKYDLVIYALVDSLVLHSSYSNIRLESYLFTEQAIKDIHRCLKPEGMVAMYNYFRQGWIVSRLQETLKHAFGGAEPVVMTFPYLADIKQEQPFGGFTLLLAGGSSHAIRHAFTTNPEYWLPKAGVLDQSLPSGFTRRPANTQDAEENWLRFGPAAVEPPQATMQRATDDWPFLYLREPMIPDLSLRGMGLMGGLSLALLFLFWPRGQQGSSSSWGIDSRMFLLGAGFMLVETKAVVHMALLWGSTWMVNSVVFFAVLVMILAANLFVLARRPNNLAVAYVGLLGSLAANAFIPLEWFLGLPGPLQIGGSCLLVAAPILFAGVIFAVSFTRTQHADRAFGCNIAGAMLGGLAENVSMLLGFPYLVLVAAGFYAASALVGRRGATPTVARAAGPVATPARQAA